MAKTRMASKFGRCVKSVRKTVKARKGSTKESAAIAICVTSVLHPRGKTLKRYRRGRLLTQKRKMKGGEVDEEIVNALSSITITSPDDMPTLTVTDDKRSVLQRLYSEKTKYGLSEEEKQIIGELVERGEHGSEGMSDTPANRSWTIQMWEKALQTIKDKVRKVSSAPTSDRFAAAPRSSIGALFGKKR